MLDKTNIKRDSSSRYKRAEVGLIGVNKLEPDENLRIKGLQKRDALSVLHFARRHAHLIAPPQLITAQESSFVNYPTKTAVTIPRRNAIKRRDAITCARAE